MCGIGGYIGEGIKENLLNEMSDILKYRGPETEGIRQFEQAGLVHRRLKIIDTSDEANQPMFSKCGEYVIVFNGEIYNFRALALQFNLQDLSTNSDTEVLLECLVNNPIEEVLSAANGMFAFALLHIPNNQLYVARDRFGQKPLYYSVHDKGFLFCSDIRGVARNFNQLSYNFKAIDYYLSEMCMPQPFTIYEDVFQLKPGHFGVFTNGVWKESSYFSIPIEDYDYSKTEEDWLDDIEKILTKAIVIRKVADVPLGYFLSSGIDSSLIVALMAKSSESPIDTYTVVSDDNELNEGDYAKQLANKYNTNHHEIKVDASNIASSIVDIVNEMGEPFADSSVIPSYLITKEMKKYVTVAISGDGGDEQFGYPDYELVYRLEKFANQSSSKQLLKSVKAKVSNRFLKENQNQDAHLASVLKEHPDAHLLKRSMSFSPKDKRALYHPGFSIKTDYTYEHHATIWNGIESKSILTRKRIGAMKSRLLNDYLVKIDRTSMYNSLEVRSPFLDYSIAELAAKIPPELNYKNGEAKYLLKKLAEKYVDPAIMNRKKMGFAIPMSKWLRSELKPLVSSYLSREKIVKRGWFNPDFIAQLIDEHMSEQTDHQHKLWSLLCLEIWLTQNEL